MTPSTPDEPTSHHSSEPPSTASEAAGLERTHDQVLADAVRVFTEAARLTRPVLVRDEAAGEGAAYPVWVTGPDREPADWAEFVSQALVGAVANVGSIDVALSGRPGSWEADGFRNLLTSTVGYDEASLLEHRTEPIVVELFVDEILVDLGAWKPYDDAQREIAARYDALGIPTASTPEGAALLAPATDEQEPQADELADLEERLEQQRERDWAAYGEALKAAVEAAAGRLEGLRVSVVVTVDLQTFRRAEDRGGDSWGPAERLLDQAIQVTPLPGDGRPPLERLS